MATPTATVLAPSTRHATRSGALDGLRGLAALAVVSSHLTGSMGLLPYPSGGFIGVLVFFALSGYLIGAIAWRAPATLDWYRTFVRRRVQRLAPVLIAMAVLLPPVMVLAHGQSVGGALAGAALALSQTTAFLRAAGFDGHPVWGPTWSLTVEWTFYLLFPLVLIAARARRVPNAVLLRSAWVLALALLAVGQFLSPRAFLLLPVANLGVMVAGGALALQHATRARAWRLDPAWGLAALGLLACLTVLPGSSLSPGYRLVVVPAVAASSLALIECAREESRVKHVLAWRPFAVAGVRAYSIYIWHVPVLWLTWSVMPDAPPLLPCAIGIALLVPVVALSFRFLERPWLSSGARRPAGPVAAPAGRPG